MKILLIHNAYGAFSGEEAVVRDIRLLLEDHGHEVVVYSRSSEEIINKAFGEIRGFFGGIYNPFTARDLKRFIENNGPDIAHVHNLFPLISPSALVACKQAGLPVVMTVHNYRLICPNGLFMSHGEVCEKCSKGREYWCLLKNCEGSLAKSLGYGLRNWGARKGRFFLDHVDVFATLTEFQKKILIREGYPVEQIVVIPNMVTDAVEESSENRDYVGFAGRISKEKGIQVLIDASRRIPDIQFRAAGNFERLPNLPTQAPKNFKFLGHLSKESLDAFYASCRMFVLPSTWFEGFPIVLVETMLRGIPIVCSRIGGLQDIVDDGVSGLLFEPGNSEQLADKIKYLWDKPELCKKMGQEGRKKALREYTPDRYYKRIIEIYEQVIAASKRKNPTA